jgi:Coenzyme F420-dependent N5,N10-methylene tetrahydromethanopterin reductase and related flavin-dependent oxidoreductases|nr:LLM class flavin-dependent oxidoreductase [uncultured Steroidobacter sp.]
MTTFSMTVTGSLPMREYVPIAQQAEQYGFDEIHVSDDLIMRPAWPILTLMAMHTQRVKLGPFIVTPQVASPVYHAANLAALDELSNGRMVCGLGRGGFNQMLGVGKPVKPVRSLKEAYLLMEHVLQAKTQPFEGEFFRATAELKFQFPTPRRIPIFIGTWGPQMARMAGGVASGIKADCIGSGAYLAKLRTEMLAGTSEAGRDPSSVQLIVGPLSSIAEDRASAEDCIRGMLALIQPFLAPMTTEAGLDPEAIDASYRAYMSGDLVRAKSLVPQKAIKAFTLTGTPRDVIEQVEELIAAGADHVSFGTPTGPDPARAMHLVGTQILPHFRRK